MLKNNYVKNKINKEFYLPLVKINNVNVINTLQQA